MPQASNTTEQVEDIKQHCICPQCRVGKLKFSVSICEKNGAGKPYWECDNTPDCRYQAQDHMGRPLGKYLCPRCGRFLKLVSTKQESFWACEGWFDPSNNCKNSFKNVDGIPEDEEGNQIDTQHGTVRREDTCE